MKTKILLCVLAISIVLMIGCTNEDKPTTTTDETKITEGSTTPQGQGNFLGRLGNGTIRRRNATSVDNITGEVIEVITGNRNFSNRLGNGTIRRRNATNISG